LLPPGFLATAADERTVFRRVGPAPLGRIGMDHRRPDEIGVDASPEHIVAHVECADFLVLVVHDVECHFFTLRWGPTPSACAFAAWRRSALCRSTLRFHSDSLGGANVGLRPTPRLGRSRGPFAPRRSLAGALCAPPLCGNENRILVKRRITV